MKTLLYSFAGICFGGVIANTYAIYALKGDVFNHIANVFCLAATYVFISVAYLYPKKRKP